MKNNKKSPQTIARQAAFRAEMGGEFPREMSPEFQALCAELIGQDTPEMVQNRIAAEGTVQGYCDGKVLSDGSYARESGPEVDFGTGYRMHSPGIDAQAEVDEIGQAIMSTATHKGQSDNGETEAIEAGTL